MTYQRPGAREGFAAFGVLLAAIAVVGLIILGGWQAGWWFRTQDTNRQAQLDKQGVGYQLPLQVEIGDEITKVTDLNTQLVAAKDNPDLIGTLAATRKAIVIQICRQSAQVNPATPLSSDQEEFARSNCFAGGISPTSLYK
jgi:hypothetical protein